MLRLLQFPTSRIPLFLLEPLCGENWQMENERTNLFIESLFGSLEACESKFGYINYTVCPRSRVNVLIMSVFFASCTRKYWDRYQAAKI